MTDKNVLIDWIKDCPKGKRWVVIKCDTFEYSDYPVYCDAKEALHHRDTDGQNMQKVMECYDTKLDLKTQLNQNRCHNWPTDKDIAPKKTVVSSEETGTLATYCVSATTGYIEHESTYRMWFQFSDQVPIKDAVTNLIKVLRAIVMSALRSGVNSWENACCTKHAKKKGRNKLRFCPDCGTKLDVTQNPEPDEILEAYNSVFCRDFVISHDLYEQLESEGIQCGWIDDNQSAKLVTISGIDYLVAGIKGRSTVEIADMKIGKGKTLKL